MFDARAFLGFPIEFGKLCLIYPPKVKDILNTHNYSFYEKILTISQEEIEDELVERGETDWTMTPLEYVLNLAYNDNEYRQGVKQAFQFFIKEDITFLYNEKKIIIGDLKTIDKEESLETLRYLTEDNYLAFQNAIRISLGKKALSPPKQDEDPRVRRIKAKARYRDRVKAKSNKGLNLSSILASICCMNMGLNPLNIGELSYAAVSILIAYYQGKEKYDLDIRSLLAGADKNKIQIEYWIKNLED